MAGPLVAFSRIAGFHHRPLIKLLRFKISRQRQPSEKVRDFPARYFIRRVRPNLDHSAILYRFELVPCDWRNQRARFSGNEGRRGAGEKASDEQDAAMQKGGLKKAEMCRK